MNSLLGIMQGRLISKEGFFPQDFPWENWQEEFWLARKYGIDCIEWMFNTERFYENPIWTEKGRKEIQNVIFGSGVIVNSICANYFMQHSIEDSKDAVCILNHLAEAGKEIGVRQIIIPLFGASEILDIQLICEIFRKICVKLSESGIYIGFESDIPAVAQKMVCDTLRTDRIGICYDVGNAAGNGYDSAADVTTVSKYLLEVHLKDKTFKGKSVMLGEGAVDFDGIFKNQKNKDRNVYILESYFGKDAEEDTIKNLQYIRGKMNG